MERKKPSEINGKKEALRNRQFVYFGGGGLKDEKVGRGIHAKSHDSMDKSQSSSWYHLLT
jgi:hypothetical protein